MNDISQKDRLFLLKLARKTLNSFVKDGTRPSSSEEKLSEQLLQKRGCFVTIHLRESHRLRGCVGCLTPVLPLYRSIIDSAVNAACDPRFPPLSEEEMDNIDIEISVLSIPKRLIYSSPDDLLSKLVPHRDGVILEFGNSSATFLPQVWESLPEKSAFLSELSLKGGAPSDAWKRNGCRILVYYAEVFNEQNCKGLE